MADESVDVLLVTDDHELRGRVTDRCPPRLCLRCVDARNLRLDTAPACRQLWLDLDTACEGHRAPAARRVYFHSATPPASDQFPPGLFIRKPCSPTVLEILWAAAESDLRASVEPRRTAPRHPLPPWVLDFQELNLKVLCRRCTADLPPRLGYRSASLYLHDERAGLLRLAETTHAHPVDLAVPLRAGHPSLMVRVSLERTMLRTDRVHAELQGRGLTHEPTRDYPDESCLIAPLVSDGQLWGVLNLSGCVRTADTELGLPLREIFLFLSRALHHACAFDRARVEARVDSLTGLYNQRWMLETLESEIRRAQRFNSALSVLMIDLDGLKSVNDADGHSAGDSVLRHVACRIGSVLRQFDGAARVGGDEFVIMLPGTNLKGARHVAARVLQAIRDDAAQVGDRMVSVTASAGAAEWHAGWNAGQLIDAADQAMYRAKQRGRDQLTCADSPASDALNPSQAVTSPEPPDSARFMPETPAALQPARKTQAPGSSKA